MSLFNITEHVIDAAHIRGYPRATAEDQDAPFKLQIKQYTPKDGPPPQKGDVTIIGSHANGFPKELYEPLWDALLQELQGRGVGVRGIWIADCAWQGRSGVLNREDGLLGNDPHWHDYSRDMLHMINTFRMPRPLVAVGHSFGANALAQLGLMHPRLFHSMVLLEAVIAAHMAGPDPRSVETVAASAARRDEWPSRRDAAVQFGRSSFYRSWHPRVLELWIEHGLRDASPDGAGAVALTTTKHQEVFTFLRPSWLPVDRERARDLDAALANSPSMYPFYRAEPIATHAHIAHLRPGVLFVNGAKSNIIAAQECKKRTAITGTGAGGSGGVAAGRVMDVTHPHHGHLVPLEDPAFCAQEAASFLKVEMVAWATEEKEYEAWTRQSNEQKTTISQDWKTHLNLKERPRSKM